MKRNIHEWKKRTPDGRRVYRAWTERGDWIVESALEVGGRAGRRRSAEDGPAMEWELEDPPSLEDLKLFREVLWNKYQRGRVAYKHVERLDAMIESTLELTPEDWEDERDDHGYASQKAGDWDEVGEEDDRRGEGHLDG